MNGHENQDDAQAEEDFLNFLQSIQSSLMPEDDDSDEESDIDPATIQDPQARFLYAAEKNHLALVQTMLHTDPTLINIRDTPDGYSALHRAAYNNHSEMIRELLRRGADGNGRTLEGRTPLHSACFWNCKEAAEILLKNGADINAVSVCGLSPLHLAASRKDARELVKFLLGWPGVDPSILSSAGETAAVIARRSGPFFDLFTGDNKAVPQQKT